MIIPPCITLLHRYRRDWLGMTKRIKKQMSETYRG
jgi:hypothetical protein